GRRHNPKGLTMASDTMRVEKFPFGIASISVGEIERRIPSDEPPPLPVNAALQVIGKPARRQGVRAVLVIAPKDAILRYVGAPVAAVAARTPAAADAALRLIRVEYAPLPFVVDPDLARRPDAPAVYPAGETPPLAVAEIPVATGLALTGNVRGPDTQGSRGDLTQGF